jgi:hypothetical protein
MPNETESIQGLPFLLKQLSNTIRRNEEHQDYKRVNELAKLYNQLVTGEEMGSLLHQFTPRESREMFEQRMRITQHITKTVSQNVIDIYFKVPRSNSVSRVVTYADNNIDKLNEFNSKLNEFWGDDSLDDYMATRWFELNFIDPNAFVVTEWTDTDTTAQRYMPYPFEVSSKMAVNFEYFNNDLVYLISKTLKTIVEWDKKEKADVTVKLTEYTIYGRNQVVKFVQLSPKDADKVWKANRVAINAALREGIFIIGDYFVPDINKDDIYLIIIPTPHNLGYVPARRVGFKRDLYTNGRTYVSPIDKATPILMKMVKANSELDLTMALHAFPQKIQYVSKCKATDCRDGQTVDGGLCVHCNGSGYEIITSAQDTITLAMPKAKEDMADLSNIIRYEYPPVDLVKFQDDYIDKLTVYVKEAVFNTELFSKKEVSETATGKNISLQNVYDSLYPVAKAFSKTWKFLVTTVADITELNDKLIAFYNFSKDFKLKSLSDLYLDLKMVGDARASEFVKSSIESDIASIIYSEDEFGYKRYNVKQSFFPFSGKTPEQIMAVIGGNQVSQFTKVFWANYGFIFDSVELEQAELNVNFYDLNRTKQWEIISAKVEELMSQIEEEQPEPAMEDINQTTDKTDTTTTE